MVCARDFFSRTLFIKLLSSALCVLLAKARYWLSLAVNYKHERESWEQQDKKYSKVSFILLETVDILAVLVNAL